MNHSPFDLSHQNTSIDSKIIASLERVSQAFRVLLWNESKEFSLTPIQVQVIIFLLHHPEEMRKISYIAEEFNMTKATISDTIKALEQKQLITKIYGQEDGRSYVIELTSKGHHIAQSTSLFTNEIQKPIRKLDQAEKEKLLISLLDIIYHLNRTGIITIQRMCLTCRFYATNMEANQHYCKLLNQNLHISDLRVDCPEHQTAN